MGGQGGGPGGGGGGGTQGGGTGPQFQGGQFVPQWPGDRGASLLPNMNTPNMLQAQPANMSNQAGTLPTMQGGAISGGPMQRGPMSPQQQNWLNQVNTQGGPPPPSMGGPPPPGGAISGGPMMRGPQMPGGMNQPPQGQMPTGGVMPAGGWQGPSPSVTPLSQFGSGQGPTPPADPNAAARAAMQGPGGGQQMPGMGGPMSTMQSRQIPGMGGGPFSMMGGGGPLVNPAGMQNMQSMLQRGGGPIQRPQNQAMFGGGQQGVQQPQPPQTASGQAPPSINPQSTGFQGAYTPMGSRK